MRDAFINTLMAVAREDSRIFLLTGDLGYSVLERFQQEFPDRFINAGVAENNMIGMAAGLALEEKKPIVYSIAQFISMRCVEHVRLDICLDGADVKLVGVGGGLGYGAQDPTHHATEDLAAMRALPGMTVVAPADPVETELATRAAIAHDGLVYLRLGKNGEPKVHREAPPFLLGKALTLREGSDVTLIATGGVVHTALKAADILAAKGIQSRVVSMHTVKPIDAEAVVRAAAETRAIATIEEHNILGGLGGAVAEVFAESGQRRVPFRRFGLPDRFVHEVGSQTYLRKLYGLDPESLAAALAPWLASAHGLP